MGGPQGPAPIGERGFNKSQTKPDCGVSRQQACCHCQPGFSQLIVYFLHLVNKTADTKCAFPLLKAEKRRHPSVK